MKKKETLHSYLRVSSYIQLEGASLDTQEELGAKKANELGFKHQVWNEGSASSNKDDYDNRPVLRILLCFSLRIIMPPLIRKIYVFYHI